MYNRTQNENGTCNTRCLYCFMTVASAVETDSELEILETRHICPERALAELLARKTEQPALAKHQ
jgi:molybdenum cofactor biosynthesis enzyme MoaA